MRVDPVRGYVRPKYPVRGVIDQHPELLRLVPRRWQGNSVVLSVLAGTALLTSGYRVFATEATPVSRVAPVFQHGDGHCVPGTTSSPVFLPEDEARQVIVEEGKRAGIEFVSDTKTLPLAMLVPQRSKDPRINIPFCIWNISLKLDGLDRKRQIAYEYVSQDDMAEWERVNSSSLPGGRSILYAATLLRDSVEKSKPQETFGTFYDPAAGDVGLNSPEGAVEQIKVKSREELRKQVQDFIKWLKSQGVI